jgi:hypothetical protein|tara:strand:- start:248 stop:631 length:384 start_codon:yes stop_codon:yes gene_type:complete
MSEEQQNSITKIINSIDTDQLGEMMCDKAESLQNEYSDNIVIFDITTEDLINENFVNLRKLTTIEYGDWDSLKNWISESEVEKIKKQFIEDLKDAISNGDGEIDDYCQLYSSFLYCNGEYVWGGTSF